MAPETVRTLHALPKGDALVTARLAGIMVAVNGTSRKKPPVEIESTASTTAQTGVEMEALVAAAIAALTLYDMAKAVDKGMVVEDVQLVEKTKDPA